MHVEEMKDSPPFNFFFGPTGGLEVDHLASDKRSIQISMHQEGTPSSNQVSAGGWKTEASGKRGP